MIVLLTACSFVFGTRQEARVLADLEQRHGEPFRIESFSQHGNDQWQPVDSYEFTAVPLAHPDRVFRGWMREGTVTDEYPCATRRVELAPALPTLFEGVSHALIESEVTCDGSGEARIRVDAMVFRPGDPEAVAHALLAEVEALAQPLGVGVTGEIRVEPEQVWPSGSLLRRPLMAGMDEAALGQLTIGYGWNHRGSMDPHEHPVLEADIRSALSPALPARLELVLTSTSIQGIPDGITLDEVRASSAAGEDCPIVKLGVTAFEPTTEADLTAFFSALMGLPSCLHTPLNFVPVRANLYGDVPSPALDHPDAFLGTRAWSSMAEPTSFSTGEPFYLFAQTP